MIEPTPGRIVWYWPLEPHDRLLARLDDQPLAAMVACVHTDRCVNLSVCDASGTWWPRTSVRLLQPEDERPTVEGREAFCEWMPYQVGQAAKHAELEAARATS